MENIEKRRREKEEHSNLNKHHNFSMYVRDRLEQISDFDDIYEEATWRIIGVLRESVIKSNERRTLQESSATTTSPSYRDTYNSSGVISKTVNYKTLSTKKNMQNAKVLVPDTAKQSSSSSTINSSSSGSNSNIKAVKIIKVDKLGHLKLSATTSASSSLRSLSLPSYVASSSASVSPFSFSPMSLSPKSSMPKDLPARQSNAEIIESDKYDPSQKEETTEISNDENRADLLQFAMDGIFE